MARACRRAARALLPLTGGFVYFDAADRICQINAFAAYQDLRNGGLDDGSAAAVLDAAEDILNAVGEDVMAQVEAERADNQRRGLLKRIFGKKR